MATRRRQRQLPALQIAVAILIVTVIWLTWHNAKKLLPAGDAEHALAAVEQFYKFEQVGDFGSSWELFHPLMQQHFSKADYIQKRAHIILQDFGVTTFQVKAGHPTTVADWKMSADAAPITEVYEIIVTQTFQSPYGNFEIVQPCYAANDAGVWKLLWSYQAEHTLE